MILKESGAGWLRAFIAGVLLVGCANVQFSSFSPEANVQRIVVLPDTQCYAFAFPEILQSQGDWIVANRETLNFVGVIHLGDIVETNTTQEWGRAETALAPVIQAVPTVLLPGNHDFGSGGSSDTRTSHMGEYFPAEGRFPGYEGETFAQDGWNSWTIVELAGQRWLLMGLEFASRREVVDWAKTVLSKEQYDHALVATHAYLASDGLRYSEPGATNQPFHPENYGLFSDESVVGQDLWEQLIAGSPRVDFVLSGHVPMGFDYRRVSRESGGDVIELLVDYQRGTVCPTVGGDGQGYLQVLEFVPGPDGHVRMVAYSPWLDRFSEAHGALWILEE